MFLPDGDDAVIATVLTQGPWDPNAQYGGCAAAGVLVAPKPGELRGEHLLHHHRTSRGRERQQAVAHRAGDISHRDRRVQRQPSQRGRRVRGRDRHYRYLLHR